MRIRGDDHLSLMKETMYSSGLRQPQVSEGFLNQGSWLWDL